MGARFRHSYLNETILGGTIRDPVDEGMSPSGGRKVSCWLDNPCKEDGKERFDLHLRVRAFGKVADKLEELASMGALVNLVGALSTVRTHNQVTEPVLLVDQIVEQ